MPRSDTNLTTERASFVTHLECSMTGETYPADQLHNLSRVGRPLLVRYDLDGVRAAMTREALADRPEDLWRYRELLPVRRKQDIVSLGENFTPLVPMPRLAERAGGGDILVKEEGAPAHRFVQGARPGHGRLHGEGARREAYRHADQRQCRRGNCRPMPPARESAPRCSARRTRRR